ncbi:MAG: hypothetical protein Q4C83_02925 [Candidatus Saccharibacteria bacterium]|nr:hypothetical protein [Candidatus Saccharibacteria bacterium]
MSKQTLWVKKRTTRGNGRPVKRTARASVKNIDRDVRKNQFVYAWYLLKIALLLTASLVWLRLGIVVGPFTALPIGLILALAVAISERFTAVRKYEIGLVCLACLASYFLPIGIVF